MDKDLEKEMKQINPFMNNLFPVHGSRYQQDVFDMRNSIEDYVNNPIGKMDWQLDYIRRA